MNSYSTSCWSLLLIYRPREDERLSWPCLLTYSGRFTHINGYPSAAGPVQTSESSPIRDRRSTTEPPNQQSKISLSELADTTSSSVFSHHIGIWPEEGKGFVRTQRTPWIHHWLMTKMNHSLFGYISAIDIGLNTATAIAATVQRMVMHSTVLNRHFEDSL